MSNSNKSVKGNLSLISNDIEIANLKSQIERQNRIIEQLKDEIRDLIRGFQVTIDALANERKKALRQKFNRTIN